jgi:hypothetical protein
MQGGFAAVKVLGFIAWCGLGAYRYTALKDRHDKATFFVIAGIVSASLLTFEFTYLPD